MSVCVITGSDGLVGNATARHFAALGLDVVGVDADMRERFFGHDGATASAQLELRKLIGSRFSRFEMDVRDDAALGRLFGRFGNAVALVVHAAAQPSHDWSASDPITDFDINARGTLNVLEAVRRHCPRAVFILTSTNKVYGDSVNSLPLVELETRWEIDPTHRYRAGVDETMSLDASLHSVFGVSKLAADLMTQEYGLNFGIHTTSLRCGTITGSAHAGTQQHGFLAYLARCAREDRTYIINGYGGKQVRDILHATDLARCFEQVLRAPRSGAAYNMGGGRNTNCSVLELLRMIQDMRDRPVSHRLTDEPRVGDHLWWISDTAKFEAHYPEWRVERSLEDILAEML